MKIYGLIFSALTLAAFNLKAIAAQDYGYGNEYGGVDEPILPYGSSSSSSSGFDDGFGGGGGSDGFGYDDFNGASDIPAGPSGSQHSSLYDDSTSGSAGLLPGGTAAENAQTGGAAVKKKPGAISKLISKFKTDPSLRQKATDFGKALFGKSSSSSSKPKGMGAADYQDYGSTYY